MFEGMIIYLSFDIISCCWDLYLYWLLVGMAPIRQTARKSGMAEETLRMVRAEASRRIRRFRVNSQKNQTAREELATQLREQLHANKGARAHLEIAFDKMNEAYKEMDEAYDELDDAHARVNAAHVRVNRTHARMNEARAAMEHVWDMLMVANDNAPNDEPGALVNPVEIDPQQVVDEAGSESEGEDEVGGSMRMHRLVQVQVEWQ